MSELNMTAGLVSNKMASKLLQMCVFLLVFLVVERHAHFSFGDLDTDDYSFRKLDCTPCPNPPPSQVRTGPASVIRCADTCVSVQECVNFLHSKDTGNCLLRDVRDSAGCSCNDAAYDLEVRISIIVSLSC